MTPITTAEYSAGKLVSPRPAHSALRLDKLAATGFVPPSAADRLRSYLAGFNDGTTPRPIPR